MNELKDQLNDYLVGPDLIRELTVLPNYKNDLVDTGDRLIALLDVYKLYLPTRSTIEIYNRLYLSLISSLEKKNSILNVQLANDNFRTIRGQKRYGVIGGLESFKITGNAGLGKTSSVQRCMDVITNNKVLSDDRRKIIPILFVECVADGSFKSLLYQILKEIDCLLDTNYFIANKHNTTTVDVLLSAVSNVLINHVAVLVIDEIERVANNSKSGEILINYLTQLVNQSNISICFVGNESANSYFERKEYLSRRTIGLSITKMNYDEYFYSFVKTLFNYQYTLKKVEFNSEYSRLFYKLSNGKPAMIVSLFVESQRVAIISGKEIMDIKLIEDTFNSYFSTMVSYIDKDEKKLTKVKKYDVVLEEDKEEVVDKDLFNNVCKMTNKDTIKSINLLKNKISVDYVWI